MMVVPNITYTNVILSIQLTGVLPISISLKVPPPTEVTSAIIRIPKTSIFLRIAVSAPDIAKEMVPSMSMIVVISIIAVCSNYNLRGRALQIEYCSRLGW